MFDEVAVVTDARTVEEANVIRTWLESLRLRVDFRRLVQTRQLDEFFRDESNRKQWTVLATHGDGEALVLNLVHQASEDWEAVDGWEDRKVRVTPAYVREHVKGTGVLIALACGGGNPDLAQAFLDVGYEAYIAMEPSYADFDAAVLFVCALFHFLRAEDRDEAPLHYSLEAAVEAARAIDPWKYGTTAFVCRTTNPAT